MGVHHVKYVLVGGGLASSAAADAIREIDPLGSIMMVGQEIVRPYHRPALSKEYLRRQTPREELFAHPQDWFEQNQIEFRSGRRAANLDVVRGCVTLDHGETVAYDKLLLATGMSPKLLDVPGATLPNLFYLRTLEDAHHLHTAIDKAKQEGHAHVASSRTGPRGVVSVIGAGLLGVEVAASLAQMGLSVDLFCSREQPWDKFAGDVVGKSIAGLLQKHGVRVHPRSRPIRLEGDGRVQRIVIDQGKWTDCDFAVAAVGGMTHRELLRGTPISAETAILADSHCRTNAPNVYAAGDCAAIFDPHFGKHRIVDHRDHAIMTGRLAGRNMAGVETVFESGMPFWSQVFDLTLKGWGEARLVERRIVRNVRTGNGDSPDVVEVGIAADGKIAQILALGHPGDHEILRSAVLSRARVDGLEEMVKDPSIPLGQCFAPAGSA